jgi:hypothetical protein
MRVGGRLWTAGKNRAGEFGWKFAPVVRALIRGFVAGEADDLVARHMTTAMDLDDPEDDGPQTEHLPFSLPSGVR